MCLAYPAKIKSIDKDTAVVDFGSGVHKKISLGILRGVKKNDFVLVHAGFAIGKVKREEASKTQQALKELRNVLRG